MCYCQQQAISFPRSVGSLGGSKAFTGWGGTFHKESHLRRTYCSEAPPGGSTCRLKAGPSFPLQQTSSSIALFWLRHQRQTRKATSLSNSCSVSVHGCALGFVCWSLNATWAPLEVSGLLQMITGQVRTSGVTLICLISIFNNAFTDI